MVGEIKEVRDQISSLQQEIQEKETKIVLLDSLQELLDIQEGQIQGIEKRLADMLVQVGYYNRAIFNGEQKIIVLIKSEAHKTLKTSTFNAIVFYCSLSFIAG